MFICEHLMHFCINLCYILYFISSRKFAPRWDHHLIEICMNFLKYTHKFSLFCHSQEFLEAFERYHMLMRWLYLGLLGNIRTAANSLTSTGAGRLGGRSGCHCQSWNQVRLYNKVSIKHLENSFHRASGITWESWIRRELGSSALLSQDLVSAALYTIFPKPNAL